MATYHLEVKAHSRSNGRNAVALSSYRSGESLRLHSEGKVRNCRRHEKSDVLHTLLINSRGLSREEIWNKAEIAERRKDAVVSRHPSPIRKCGRCACPPLPQHGLLSRALFSDLSDLEG